MDQKVIKATRATEGTSADTSERRLLCNAFQTVAMTTTISSQGELLPTQHNLRGPQLLQNISKTCREPSSISNYPIRMQETRPVEAAGHPSSCSSSSRAQASSPQTGVLGAQQRSPALDRRPQGSSSCRTEPTGRRPSGTKGPSRSRASSRWGTWLSSPRWRVAPGRAAPSGARTT